jgi:putative membrane protein
VIEPRIYELTGHLGALGVVSIVLGVILWAAVMTVLVLLIVDLVRRQRRSGAPGALPPASAGPVPQGADALRMLNERYALGEIDHDDYVQRRGDLTGV